MPRGPRLLAAAVAAIVLALLAAGSATAAGRPCPASVKAPSAIVFEVESGKVACERNADQERPVGSTVKMMTALLTLEHASLSADFKAASYHPSAAESLVGLLPGERMKVRDLLRGLLVTSGNDAAMTLAQGVGGSEKAFVRMMNARAQELGLTHTRYTNPIGLDEPGQHSTARDLVKLGRVLRLQPFARSLVDRPEITLSSGAHARTFKNRNGLVLKYPWANGIKTGHTSGAGWVLVGAGKRNGVQLVSAVLGTPSETARDADSARLLKWGFRQFKVVAYPRPEDLAREAVPIRYRRGARMPLVPGKQLRLVVPRQGDPGVQVRVVKKPADVEGPVFTTTPLGAAQIVRDGKLIRTVPLFAQSYVPKADLAQRTKAAATNPLWVVLAFAALGGTVLLARSRRRNGRPRRRRAREEARAT